MNIVKNENKWGNHVIMSKLHLAGYSIGGLKWLCYQVENIGGLGIGGLKSSLCCEMIWLSPVSNLLCGFWKELGGRLVAPCKLREQTVVRRV